MLKYLNQVDDIIVVKSGEIIEHGSFRALMAKKGHLATIISEHLSDMDRNEDYEQVDDQDETNPRNIALAYRKSRGMSLAHLTGFERNIKAYASNRSTNSNKSFQDDADQHQQQQQVDPSLTMEQIMKRSRLSISYNVPATEANLSMIIESRQMSLVGSMNAVSAAQVIERNEISVLSQEVNIESPVPTDAEPIKLVLEDQSVKYPVSPFVSYLKAGSGIPITVPLFAFFFLVHGVRIGSGKIKHIFIRLSLAVVVVQPSTITSTRAYFVFLFFLRLLAFPVVCQGTKHKSNDHSIEWHERHNDKAGQIRGHIK
jgi:hypothetical protein